MSGATLGTLTAAEFWALHEALGQFVENEQCRDDGGKSEHGAAASAVLDRMNAQIAAIALAAPEDV